MATADSDPNWRDHIAGMTAPPCNEINLSLGQRFDLARMNLAIESLSDVEELRKVAKELFEAWQLQRAATNWVISQQTGWSPNDLRDHPTDR